MYKICCLLLFLAICTSAYKRRFLAPPFVQLNDLPPEQWFEQTLDHSNPTDLRTWKQRYFVNDTFYNKGSDEAPIFLMIGGEGEAAAEWLVAGAWIEYGEKVGALCFQLEHRFYGKSRPLKDMSIESLAYLNSEQALGDLANFVVEMNVKFNLTNENKWIAFGGSYPGSLAAWLRYKYPHLIHAAISTSGPLLAKADFKEYNDVVKESLKTSFRGCAAAVKEANKHMTKLFNDPAGGLLITEQFRLCGGPLDITNKNDISNLAETLADNFAGVVQYNKDNRMTQNPASKVTIDDLCSIMSNSSYGNELLRYAMINSLMLDVNSKNCTDYKYSESIESIRKVDWTESPEPAERQWLYQTCVEFGFYQTSSSEEDLFGPNFPLDYYIQQCKDIYGDKFGKKVLDEGIARTNTIYGDLHLRVSRVLFVHGSIDPWHALGITSSKNPDAPAILIKGTAHCANMYPSNDTDLPSLKEARKKIERYLTKWLNDYDY